jgi:hypothetical protein
MQGSFPPNTRRLAHGCCKAAVCRLVEDDGETHSASYRLLEVTTERYETDSFRYRVVGVEQYWKVKKERGQRVHAPLSFYRVFKTASRSAIFSGSCLL